MKKLFILLFIAATFSVAGYSQTYHYDVNGDGVVTVADVTAIYNYLLGNLPVEPTDDKEYVDLGLPSGTLWATVNIGANSMEDYGDYFAWGETAPKYVYNWSSYKWCNGSERSLTKYCTSSSYGTVDNMTELDLDDDAAYVNWGPEWRMPSQEQIQELMDNCTTYWTTINGVNGRLFTSNINGVSLFLPAAGYRYEGTQAGVGSRGDYWSRNLRISIQPYALYISSSSVGMEYGIRDHGFTVRAVRASQK